jgi:hypothetical protein
MKIKRPGLPVTYRGRTERGWHRYYAERPMPLWVGRHPVDFTVHVDRSRFLAWWSAWYTWLNIRLLDREV